MNPEPTVEDFPHTTRDVAARLGCSSRTVTNRAKAVGVGVFIGGTAGMRFSERDIQRLVDSLRPAPAPAKQRRKRRTRGVPA